MSTSKKITLAALLLAPILLLLLTTYSQPNAPEIPPTETQITAPMTDSPETLAEFWQEQAATSPDDPKVLYQFALVLTITNPEQAGVVLDQLEAISKDYTQQINRLRAALRRGQAIDDHAYQLIQAGQALASLEETALAEIALQMAVEENPDYAEAWAYLGEIQSQNGEDGYTALQTALTLNPESYAANIFMGLYWRRNDQPDKALPFMQKALDADPGNLSLLTDLANTMIAAGEVEAAFELLNRRIEDTPENDQLWEVLARLSIDNDIQVEQVGIPAARQVVMENPDQAEPLILLGSGYLVNGNTHLAERFFSQASQAAPNLAEPHYYLGLLYYNQRDYTAAQTHLQTAIQLAQANGNTVLQEQAEKLLEQVFE